MNLDDRVRLRSQFNGAFVNLGVEVHEIPSKGALLDRYAEPQRYYHTLDHIYHLITAVGQLSDLQPTVVVAGFYHDCVYEIGAPPRANEVRSALVMLEDLGEILPNYLLREISSLIMATFPGDYKLPPRSLNEAVLRDADLAGFADKGACVENGKKIRQEFGAFSDDEYVIGRDAFLQSMLDLPQIYWSPEAVASGWEEAARVNIEQEMKPPAAQTRCTNCNGTGRVNRRIPLESHGGNAPSTSKPCPVCQ